MDTLQFHVAALLKEPIGATRQLDVAASIGNIDEAVATTAPVTGRAKLVRTKEGLLVDADLRTGAMLSCSRCLVDLSVPLIVRFREEFRPIIDVNTGLPLAEPEDQSTFLIGEDHVLDLGEAFRQYALLALPMAPLCQAACAGLCPQCGHNLNEGQCECTPALDERWHALADLMKEQNEGAYPSGRLRPRTEEGADKKKRKR